MAIKQLNALSTGLNGKRNVFIPNINDFKTNSFQKVVVFIPGIRATVERRANDTLVVTELELDPNESYMAIARGNKKPGVYTIKISSEGQAAPEYKNNGRITPENNRNVVIADTEYESPAEAAKIVLKKLDEIIDSNASKRGSFDMFYAPVGDSLGGMRNYNPALLTQSYGFAGLLADAMEKAKDQTGIVWASQGSGCVVLTQGLQALAAKGVSFDEKYHSVKMHKPTTNPWPTLVAANQLNMHADKQILQGGGHMYAVTASLLTNAHRAKDKNDTYSWKDYANDIANGTATTAGALGAVTVGAGLFTSSPLLAAVGAVTGAVWAIHFASKAVKKRFF